jgi:2-phosphosulfolactate phosphatase
MKYKVNVYSLPQVVAPEELADGTTVVIDVLRSTTTIAFALEAGAKRVLPAAEVDEARALAARFPSGEAILGGERRGLPIDGFDLGNSPGEYTPERVRGKTIVLTTTNGTRAMARTRLSQRVLIGSFVNASAVCRQLFGLQEIHLLCSGTDGRVSRDDVLLAGMLVERLQREGGLSYKMNAQAVTALEVWLSSFSRPRAIGAESLPPQVLAQELRDSLGGRNLVEIGLEKDILAAAEIDRFANIPILNTGDFCIEYE